MIIKRVVVGSLETNCYILGSQKNAEAIIIDPGDDFPKIINAVRENNLAVKFVVNTHAHQDHIGANNKFNVPILIHKDDAPFFTNPELNLSTFSAHPLILSIPHRVLNDGDRITVGEITLEIIHTPGHTPGGICLKKDKDFIFTGDTLFSGGVGRTDLPLASEELLRKSITEKLFTLDEKMIIYPGHGPSSTIGKERERNPFL